MESRWKSLPDYEGSYEYNHFGQIRSLDRMINDNGTQVKKRGRELKEGRHRGYCSFRVSKHNIEKTFLTHRLVWEYHNGPIPHNHEIHHIDEDKTNNNISNLFMIEERLHGSLHKKGVNPSRFSGVTWCKNDKIWRAKISINGKQKHLGTFKIEEDAHEAYLQAIPGRSGK